MQVTHRNSASGGTAGTGTGDYHLGQALPCASSCFLPNHLSVPHAGMVLGTLFIGGSLVAGQQLTGGDLMSFLVASQTVQR